MERFAGVARDTSGNALANVTIDVFFAGTTTPAIIYSSNAYAALTNPFTGNVDGSWFFYAAPGRYDTRYTKSNFSFGTAPTYDQLGYDYMSVISPAQITANQNNYAPVNGLNVEQWRLSTDANRTITGIDASTAVSGQSLTLFNIGAFGLTLNEQDALSSPNNRIITGIGNVLINAGQSAMLKYDSTTLRWRVLASPITQIITVTNVGDTFTGLGMSNAAGDPTNDVTVAVGGCSSNDAVLASRVFMSLTSALTKQLDAVWAVGNNQGGRASGAAIANTTYHVFVILRPDTGVVDVAYDTDVAGANISANTNAAYTKIRRIGSILREAGAIATFTQDGDYFRRGGAVLDVNAANPGAGAVTRTLSVPIGVSVQAFGGVFGVITTGATDLFVLLSDLAASDEVPISGRETVNSNATKNSGVPFQVHTTTAAQIRSRLSFSDATVVLIVYTFGWIDRRGQG